MFINKIKILIILILLINNKVPTKNISKKKIDNDNYLIIEKINLKQPFFNINNENNTIEKNIEILKESIMPDKNNSIVFIAAHSGEGDIAYFNSLIDLNINDELILYYKNKYYKYSIIEKYEEPKNGYIDVDKYKEKQLVLTTCHPYKKNKQLVINAIKKEI